MSRNGGIAEPFRAGFTARTHPNTGVTVKMLAYWLARQGEPISDDTLVNYRDDRTKIPGDAIRLLDRAFSHFGFPGFQAEVYGCLPPGVGAARASSAPADGVAPIRAAEECATADACWWATHEGTLHSAARGHADFARRYLDLPQDTQADSRRFAINHLGWLALTRFADGRLVLEGDATRNAAARERVAAWLESRADQPCGPSQVCGGALPHAMPVTEAASFLRGLGGTEPHSAWSAEEIGQNDLADPAARDLWRAIHDAGIERAHMVEIAGRMGLLDRCSLFVVENDDVISANVGSSLPVDRAVVGRNVLARRDLDYARQLRAGILASRAGPTASRIRLNGPAGILGGYDRAAWAQRTGRHRWQVLSTSSALSIPSNFQTLG